MSTRDLLLMLGTAIFVYILMKYDTLISHFLLEAIFYIVLISSLIIGEFLGERYLGDFGTGYSVIGGTLGATICGFIAFSVLVILEQLGFVALNKEDNKP